MPKGYPGTMTHGRASGYDRHGCRCAACKTAKAAVLLKWRSANLERSRAQHRKWAVRTLAKERCPSAFAIKPDIAPKMSRPMKDVEILAEFIAANRSKFSRVPTEVIEILRMYAPRKWAA